MKILTLFGHFVAAFARSCWWRVCGYNIIVSSAVMCERQRTCGVCPYRHLDVCSACGCLVMSKVVLSSEKCPHEFWQREKIAKTPESHDC